MVDGVSSYLAFAPIWRAKDGGMDISEARRLKDLESENAKLKKLLAEAHLEIHALKGVFGLKR